MCSPAGEYCAQAYKYLGKQNCNGGGILGLQNLNTNQVHTINLPTKVINTSKTFLHGMTVDGNEFALSANDNRGF